MLKPKQIKKFQGHLYFRQRIAMSILSGIPVRIDEIRSDLDTPGLRDYEVSILQIAEKLTNGTVIDISYTGTSILLKPGVIIGGRITHECPVSRGLGYFLEFIISFSLFAKSPVDAKLFGLTNNSIDISVDAFRTVTLPILKYYAKFESGLELQIVKRGLFPKGGGEVKLNCPIVPNMLGPIRSITPGLISKIRGVAYSARVNPQSTNRMVEQARAVLGQFSSDIYLYTDVYSGKESGLSPGFGIVLVAETTSNCLISSELCAEPSTQKSQQSQDLEANSENLDQSSNQTPEDIGAKCAYQLLTEISKSGTCDSYHQWLYLLLMTLSSEDVSKVNFGKLNKFTVQYLRDLKEFFNISFKIEPSSITRPNSDNSKSSSSINLTCVGIGYSNVNKKKT
ncbi:putative RNA 3'-terminal phosphate cyclase-like protein [Smittium culicis]|uniref:Putative RNA 3'-terminal phosphate cyclase-like protein n=1 Tax=Smittium culicis TaxID=133412 RepID=A0A1R1Y8K0_9FUNG|nr:putative RNA 3'-terminal phosphate cyclase-like protein [Smittium culicis]